MSMEFSNRTTLGLKKLFSYQILLIPTFCFYGFRFQLRLGSCDNKPSAFSGGRLAQVQDISNAVRAGFTEGCACAHVSDDVMLRGVLPFLDKSCQGIAGLPSSTQGLFECVTGVSDYAWCFRYLVYRTS